jgi:hypothetical protein
MSGATVAIINTSPPSAAPFDSKKKSGYNNRDDWWCRHSPQIAEKVWRVPSVLISNRSYLADPDRWLSTETGDLPFDYVLFAAAVTDSETPTFCTLCDGAVLVLTANQTRKESALRAKETLPQCNTEILPTLVGRSPPRSCRRQRPAAGAPALLVGEGGEGNRVGLRGGSVGAGKICLKSEEVQTAYFAAAPTVDISSESNSSSTNGVKATSV